MLLYISANDPMAPATNIVYIMKRVSSPAVSSPANTMRAPYHSTTTTAPNSANTINDTNAPRYFAVRSTAAST
jgi:hypothetical protein